MLLVSRNQEVYTVVFKTISYVASVLILTFEPEGGTK